MMNASLEKWLESPPGKLTEVRFGGDGIARLADEMERGSSIR
jgi:hypothetical protein